MRKYINLNFDWEFVDPKGFCEIVNLPHTWNNKDGQDGNNNYLRGVGRYKKEFCMPENFTRKNRLYLEFHGVSSSARVMINRKEVCFHEGGYSTFRADITNVLEEKNILEVEVDNSINRRVYPQKADFTFYGGIYRDVNLLVVDSDHFELDYNGANGIKVTPTIQGSCATIQIETFVSGDGEVEIKILEENGLVVGKGTGVNVTIVLENPHFWNGRRDPYLYTAIAELKKGSEITDRVSCRFGIRDFYVDPDKGFFLNGVSYPLHGVSKHQDRKGIGNAVTKENLKQDMELILEMGANTIRLAHYQHDQYFYDLCDEYGMIVWTEIPYISEHMPEGYENTLAQMRELIVQNYNHPSIICWGISNEITISTRNRKDMMKNHRVLNDLCHQIDPTRLTTLACYAVCMPFDPVVHKVSDLVSYNLYLGWYVPGLFLNDLFMDIFHRFWPKRCLGYSEYGAEGMPNLHSSRPRRGDHSEEYQALYHEYMLKCFQRHPFLWATYLWNMFDFAADARDQGGEPGMNHKGVVTFDRKIKKDSFYLYKAWWSEEPFVHICGKRYVNRTESKIKLRVYSNQPEVSLYQNGQLLEICRGEHVFVFSVVLDRENNFEAVAGNCRDSSYIRKTNAPDHSYRLSKHRQKESKNWV